VLSAIYGPDGLISLCRMRYSTGMRNFNWKTLRVGYLKSSFDVRRLQAGARTHRRRVMNGGSTIAKYGVAHWDELRKMGVKLIPLQMPDFPFGAIVPVLEAEKRCGVRRF